MRVRKTVGLALGALLLLVVPAGAITGVLCIKATGKGAVKVRNPVCKPAEVQVGTFDTDAPQASFNGTVQCANDAVRVGRVCVDKYEGSVWETTDVATIAAIQNSEIDSVAELSLATHRGGSGGNDYGAGCPETGNGCLNSYAVSVAGATPSAYLTWYQAAAACRNAGKRLATNQEWQMAALGTPDPGTDNGTSDCKVSAAPEFDVILTGTRSACVSDVGAFDMVGNAMEWVADWTDFNSNGCSNWSPTYGSDDRCFGGDGINQSPGPLIRGGDYSDGTDAGVFAVRNDGTPNSLGQGLGFRCAREP